MQLETVTTKYADADGLQIAYRVHGRGEQVLIVVPGLISHIELQEEMPEFCTWISALSAERKVIVFDKRGQGLSDRTAGPPGPEQRMDDVTAIARAEGVEKFSLLGYSEGAAVAILYAASFPERVQSVSVFGGFARFSNCDGYDLMADEADLLKSVKYWGSGGSGYAFIPEKMPDFRPFMAKYERACATPNAYRAMVETNCRIDIRDVLPSIQVPVLVMHRRLDAAVPVANGRYLADNLPKANYIEFAGGGHVPWFGDADLVIEAVLKFIDEASGHAHAGTSPTSKLATVLFTDIVGSSEKLAALGDRKWREVLDAHDRIAGRHLAQYQGRMIKQTGDGMLATFDGPVRGVKCAKALASEMHALDLKIRCGLHIGEVEPRAEDITGMAVHVAARVMDAAEADQILVTRALADLTPGSDISLRERGLYTLKGLPEPWMLFEMQ